MPVPRPKKQYRSLLHNTYLCPSLGSTDGVLLSEFAMKKFTLDWTQHQWEAFLKTLLKEHTCLFLQQWQAKPSHTYIANKTASKSLHSFGDWAAVQLDAPEWHVATARKTAQTILFQYLQTDWWNLQVQTFTGLKANRSWFVWGWFLCPHTLYPFQHGTIGNLKQ